MDRAVVMTGLVMAALVGGTALLTSGLSDSHPTETDTEQEHRESVLQPPSPPIIEPQPFAELGDLPPVQLPRPEGFFRGVALGLYDKQEGADYGRQLGEIADLDANIVSLVVTWGQETVRDTEVSRDPIETRDDATVAQAIVDAHEEGLEALVFPILRIRTRDTGEWRGTIAPSDVDAWFASYSEFILHYAALAETHGAEWLSIGSELGSMEVHEAHWRALIGEVRRAYSGRLLYSANWDHYQWPAFWSEMDLIGMTAYYELAESEDEVVDLELLKSRWEPIRDELVRFSQSVGRPFVFTEIGYYSQRGTAWHPWDYTRRVGVQMEEQYLCYRAFYEVWRDVPEFHGMFFWHWYGAGGSDDQTYTPRGKPAADVIRHWFAQGAD